MAIFTLNERQKELLRQLVAYAQQDQLPQPFVPIPSGDPTRFVVLIRGSDNFVFRHISDLDALCDAGYARFRWSRNGVGKLYLLTEAGETAVATNFANQPKPNPAGINLTHVMQVMSGGTAETSALNPTADVIEVANDPVQRLQHVDALTDALRQLVLPTLKPADRVIYDKDLRQFADELCSSTPNARRLHQQLRTLTFLGNVAGTLDTTTQCWPYLYPLLLLAAARTDTATPAMLRKSRVDD